MKKFIAALVAIAGIASFAAEYRIEPVNLPERGDWVGNGKPAILYCPVKGSIMEGDFEIPNGTYYGWVLVENRNEGWRKFDLLINDKKVGTFGDGKVKKGDKIPSNSWSKVRKPIEITEGKMKVAYKALSSASRAGILILSDSAEFNQDKSLTVDSAREIEEIEAE
ncbi:MAG: hypothetical protein MJ025_06910 [Victivallaceae bacterium]|nr:hypothetical protein [Victivallaceae bacterium]